LFFKYPSDAKTYAIDLQFFFGPAVLVSPITEENATTVQVYIPDDVFYDFYTLTKMDARGGDTTLEADITEIPLAIMGGSIIPMRVNGTMTTKELRQTDFELLVVPSDNNTASGSLYFDDGVSITPNASTSVSFEYINGTLAVDGVFEAPLGVNVARAVFLGVGSEPSAGSVMVDGAPVAASSLQYNGSASVLSVSLGFEFNRGFTVSFS
jgi:alpha-glucosidase